MTTETELYTHWSHRNFTAGENRMTKATLDQTLQTLHRAADHIRRTGHMNCPWTFTRDDVIAIMAAIAILEQAAKDVLGVRRTQ